MITNFPLIRNRKLNIFKNYSFVADKRIIHYFQAKVLQSIFSKIKSDTKIDPISDILKHKKNNHHKEKNMSTIFSHRIKSNQNNF